MLSSLEAMGGPAGGTLSSSDLASEPLWSPHLLCTPAPPNQCTLAVELARQGGDYTSWNAILEGAL